MANTVLIVDDSPTAVPELKMILESAEYHVLTALRAEEALETLQVSKVDAVITEALLPGIDGAEFTRRIRQNPAWADLPVIILTVRSAREDYAAGFEAGANDYFVKPVDPPKIIAAVGGGIARRQAHAHMHMPLATITGTEVQRPRTRDRGEIISVFSLKGGVGTTTIAVNLAVAIKKWVPSAHVGLIDLSLEEALDSLLLDVMPASTIVDWAQEDLAEATPATLTQYFIEHSSGVSLLAAPQSPEQAEIVKPSAVRRTLELAPQALDYIVVDTAASFTESTLITLEMSSRIVLPVTADMASLKSTVSTLRILKALGINPQRVTVVVNEIVPRAGLTKDQLESGLGKETTLIPHGGPAFIEAANHGHPLVDSNPRLPSSRALIDLARTLCDPERETLEEEAAPASGSLLRRFRTR